MLKCELNTLGYPEAALFGFCLAIVMYNVLSVVQAALRATHPEVATPSTGRGAAKKKAAFSFYYLADEISGVRAAWRSRFLPSTGRARSQS